LNLKLDVVVARKIGVPWEPELAMGALAGDARILDERMIEALAIPRADVMNAVARELAEMKRREELYRGGAPLDLRGQTAILIDDGLATGTTMLAAIQYASSLQPGGVIAAVPVGSLEACRLVRAEVDQRVTLAMPEPFGAVGQFYRDFHQVGDAEVQDLLAASDRYHVEA
jgi:predicted phosphoribosyltransferase